MPPSHGKPAVAGGGLPYWRPDPDGPGRTKYSPTSQPEQSAALARQGAAERRPCARQCGGFATARGRLAGFLVVVETLTKIPAPAGSRGGQ